MVYIAALNSLLQLKGCFNPFWLSELQKECMSQVMQLPIAQLIS